MSSITEYLPGIPKAYWRDYTRAIEPTKPLIIPPAAQKVQIIPSDIISQRGLILEFALYSNSSSLQFNVITDNRRLFGTIEQFYDAGYTFYIPNMPFITEYNTTDNIYVINLVGEIPFRENVYVYADNNTTSQITVGSMGFHAVIFNDGFYKELAALKNGKI